MEDLKHPTMGVGVHCWSK